MEPAEHPLLSSSGSSSREDLFLKKRERAESSSRGRTVKKVAKWGAVGAVALAVLSVAGLALASHFGASPAVLKGLEITLYTVGGGLGVSLLGFLTFQAIRNRGTAFSKSVLVKWFVIALVGVAAISVFAVNSKLHFLSPAAFKAAEGVAIGASSLLLIQNIASMHQAHKLNSAKKKTSALPESERLLRESQVEPDGPTRIIHEDETFWKNAMGNTPLDRSNLATEEEIPFADHVTDEGRPMPQLPVLTAMDEGENAGKQPQSRMAVRLPSVHANAFPREMQMFLGPRPEIYHLVFDNFDKFDEEHILIIEQAETFSLNLHAMALPEFNHDDPTLEEQSAMPNGVEATENGLKTTVRAAMKPGAQTVRTGKLTGQSKEYPQTLANRRRSVMPNVGAMTFKVDTDSPVSYMHVVAEVRGKKMGFFIQILNDPEEGAGETLDAALGQGTVGGFVEELEESDEPFAKETMQLYKFRQNRVINGKRV